LFVRCDQAYPETIHRGHEDCEGACLGVETVDDTVREIAACERGQMPEPEFRTIEPKILYFGTPVALISSLTEDGTTNLAPMSSFWALGWTLMLGLLDETKTAENMERHPECVVNLPAPNMWQEVEILAPLTGKNPVPEIKSKQFRFEKDKFAISGLTPLASEAVQPARARQCPVHMEARVNKLHRMGGEKLRQLGGGVAAEVEIVRVHVAPDLIIGDNYIDPAKWSPLIYNFRHYFRLEEHELGKTFRAEK
jgi:flavin reductase (DIM6/NTAB) family NADH-FMN oxidoreductase RutF